VNDGRERTRKFALLLRRANHALRNGLRQSGVSSRDHNECAAIIERCYNAAGQRVQKIIGNTTYSYFYDLSGKVVAEWYGTPGGYNGWGKGYVYLGGQLVAQYADSTTHFVHKDHLGSTRLLTKLDKSPLEAPYDYLPYGEPIGPSGSGTTHKFTGKERDAESGLDYFGARYYASTLGRFTSVDPVKITPGRLRDPQQLNQYSYVRNNPLRFIDPDGEILQIAGDVNEAQKQLCDLIGGECNRITYDEKTNTITVDLAGIDLSQNEGASLISQLVDSSNVYNLTLGDSVQTAGGPLSLGKDPIANLDRNPDSRYGKGKSATDLPPGGVDSIVGINPAGARFRDSQGRLVPLSSLIFHELAEAYSKVDGGKPYSDFQPLYLVGGNTLQIGMPERGAHNNAVRRELQLRAQRPNLQLTGRAGDVLIREPKPPKP
jgi:RHS repeat-associated protein